VLCEKRADCFVGLAPTSRVNSNRSIGTDWALHKTITHKQLSLLEPVRSPVKDGKNNNKASNTSKKLNASIKIFYL